MIAKQGEAIEEVRWGLEYTLAVQSALGMNSENSEDVSSNGMLENLRFVFKFSALMTSQRAMKEHLNKIELWCRANETPHDHEMITCVIWSSKYMQ